jgi:D-alanyl-D-alanine carboxypeptidase
MTIAARAAAQVEARQGGAAQMGSMIQIGAADDLAKANALLIRARARNRSTLSSAKPVTEMVRRGQETYYRARFALADSASAEAACRSLKRNGFSCFAAHD